MTRKTGLGIGYAIVTVRPNEAQPSPVAFTPRSTSLGTLEIVGGYVCSLAQRNERTGQRNFHGARTIVFTIGVGQRVLEARIGAPFVGQLRHRALPLCGRLFDRVSMRDAPSVGGSGFLVEDAMPLRAIRSAIEHVHSRYEPNLDRTAKQ